MFVPSVGPGLRIRRGVTPVQLLHPLLTPWLSMLSMLGVQAMNPQREALVLKFSFRQEHCHVQSEIDPVCLK